MYIFSETVWGSVSATDMLRRARFSMTYNTLHSPTGTGTPLGRDSADESDQNAGFPSTTFAEAPLPLYRLPSTTDTPAHGAVPSFTLFLPSNTASGEESATPQFPQFTPMGQSESPVFNLPDTPQISDEGIYFFSARDRAQKNFFFSKK